MTPEAPICGSCCHANDTHAHHSDCPKAVECAICRAPTLLRVERDIVVRILEKRLDAVRETEGAVMGSKTCDHDYQYFAATNENGWRCVFCKDQPGEPPGFSPELDRSRLEFKVFALLNDLTNSDLVYVSNGTGGDAIVGDVESRCRKEQRYDQYSILLFILDVMTERHALYWSKVSEAIVAGKDERERCYCGKLSTCSRGAERFCTEHWSKP
jgi:hypothetical protein